jgi:transcription elongation factor Elf1
LCVDGDAAADRLHKGLAALRYEDLHLDPKATNRMYSRILDIFKEYADLLGEVPFERDEPAAQPGSEAFQAWFYHKPPPQATSGGDAARLWWDAILHATVKPFLDAYADETMKTVDQEMWRRGYCPVCAGAPDFSFLDTDKGARWLVCSRCDAEWLFQRLQCPFCDSDRADKLAYLVDALGKYRLHVCEECRGYLKTIDLRAAGGPAFPAVERMLTFDLDRQARDLGYLPGATRAIHSSPDQ